MRLRCLPLAGLIAVAACSAGTSKHGRPGAAATMPAARLAPSPVRVTPRPRFHIASVHPAGEPASEPKPSPTVSPHRVVIPNRSPNAPPQIVLIDVNRTDVGAGDVLWGKVLTSSNVASVEVRIATFGIGLQKVGVGRFTLEYRMGAVPFFVRGTYPMHVIARNSRGDAIERTLSLTIH